MSSRIWKALSIPRVQLNEYGTFLSFLGLAQLPAANTYFYGLPDYGSSIAFELFTNEPIRSFPDAKDINVRFLFHNGSTTNGGGLAAYPLLGQEETELSWEAFAKEMRAFSITTEQWCRTCGNKGDFCATASNDPTHLFTPPTMDSLSKSLSSSLAGLVIVKKGIKGKKPETLSSAEPVKDEVFDSSPKQWL
ncbi:uncharacterized protein DFL_006311 [Arthrobotrys flagrans]|uniref:Uncharacterized protein n=1 Tax=Arthrobotrys flagrans TaxID=97331 RepID=A0A437A001_ARTFL|nr:hypothetical protein DFL_006311 [Arthrobotrys flagrans]